MLIVVYRQQTSESRVMGGLWLKLPGYLAPNKGKRGGQRGRSLGWHAPSPGRRASVRIRRSPETAGSAPSPAVRQCARRSEAPMFRRHGERGRSKIVRFSAHRAGRFPAKPGRSQSSVFLSVGGPDAPRFAGQCSGPDAARSLRGTHGFFVAVSSPTLTLKGKFS